MRTLIVQDPKGVVVGTWKRETFVVRQGDSIELPDSGCPKYAGKLLHLEQVVMDRLIRAQRVRIVEA
jgi:hypothetical protein